MVWMERGLLTGGLSLGPGAHSCHYHKGAEFPNCKSLQSPDC
uniref:Uncharacterized protein n=1 Tax=Anguilla anguilla TaxID=7936 RepID=A0A0E9XUW4_ANGAN